jgi:hypothetical protein
MYNYSISNIHKYSVTVNIRYFRYILFLPGTILGMRPAAGLCSSPFSKYNLSWKDRGATVAQIENKRRCKCPDNRKYNPC